MAKITMNVNDELLARVEKYSKAHYVNRTAVFSMAVSQWLLQAELSEAFRNMNGVLSRVAATGDLSEEDARLMSVFDSLAQKLEQK